MIAPSLPSLLVSHWHPSGVPDLAAAAAAALYLGGIARIHMRWPLRRTAAFLAGLACILVATDSGIGAYDDQLLSVHMVQHMLLLLVAPLLLLAGRPVILALRALPATSPPRARRGRSTGWRRSPGRPSAWPPSAPCSS